MCDPTKDLPSEAVLKLAITCVLLKEKSAKHPGKPGQPVTPKVTLFTKVCNELQIGIPRARAQKRALRDAVALAAVNLTRGKSNFIVLKKNNRFAIPREIRERLRPPRQTDPMGQAEEAVHIEAIETARVESLLAESGLLTERMAELTAEQKLAAVLSDVQMLRKEKERLSLRNSQLIRFGENEDARVAELQEAHDQLIERHDELAERQHRDRWDAVRLSFQVLAATAAMLALVVGAIRHVGS